MLTEEQRLKRCNGLGASDSPIIMGYSSYKTPYQLYLEKTGIVSNDDEINEQQYWGNEIEPLIIKRFAKENNVTVDLPDTIYHPEYPFLFANLDGWISAENAVVEAKCANSYQRKEWDMACSDGIPLVYLIQIAKQVAVTNATRGYCAVLIGGCEYRQFVYERDKALEDLIIQSDINFWENVEKRIEPAPINTSDCRLKFRTVSPEKVVNSTYKTGSALCELMNVKNEMKRLTDEEDKLKMKLMSHMGDAEYLMGLEGQLMATWKANKKGTRVFNIK
jgi:putative phage-type endonuclease